MIIIDQMSKKLQKTERTSVRIKKHSKKIDFFEQNLAATLQKNKKGSLVPGTSNFIGHRCVALFKALSAIRQHK